METRKLFKSNLNFNLSRVQFLDGSYIQLQSQTSEDQRQEYIRRIGISSRVGGIWGDEIALRGLSAMLHMNITVHRPDGSSNEFTCPQTYAWMDHIDIGFIGCDIADGGHYYAFVRNYSQ